MGTMRYEEWMDWYCQKSSAGNSSQSQDNELSQKVREALDRLEPSEREALELFHFLARPLDEISARMNLTRRGVERRIRSGRLKLRRLLAGYVQTRYGIMTGPEKKCVICDAEKRVEAEKIVLSKSPKETWRRVLRELREKLNINVCSPQTLVGHIKYHRLESLDNR